MKRRKDFLIVAASLVLAVLARWFFERIPGLDVPMLPFTVPVLIAAHRLGLAAGLAATLMGALVATELFDGAKAIHQGDVRIPLYLLVGGLISIITHSLNRSRQRLSEFERRYRLLVDGISDYAVIDLDQLGRITSWNDGAEKITGYVAEEIIGKSFERFYTDTDREAGVPAQMLRRATEGNLVSAEGWRTRKDGSRFWAEVAIRVFQDKDGRVIGFSQITRDVTDQRAQQIALAESEERCRALLGATMEALVCVNDSGEITTINAATERMFGYAGSELIGQKLALLLPSTDLPLTNFAEQSIQLLRGHQEVTGRRSDGSEFPIDITLTSIQLPSGRQGVAFIKDITARHEADHALRESEERFRLTFENAAFGMAHVAVDGRWLRVNRQLSEIVGYSRDELLQMTFQDITHPDDLDADLALVTELLTGKMQSYTLEKRYVRKDRSTIWIHLTVALARDNSGAPTHFISAVEDIDARKRAEAALDRRIRQQQAVADLGMAVLATGDLKSLFDQTVEALSRSLEVQFAEVLQILPNREELIVRSCVGWRPDRGVGLIFPVAGTQGGYAIRIGDAVIAEDIDREKRFTVPMNLIEHGIVSGASVVIRGAGGEPFGVLSAHSQEPNRFAADDVHFMRSLANILASAIESSAVAQEREELLARATTAEREATTILESIADAFCAYDSDWRLTYANAAAESLLSATRDQLIGRKLQDVYPHFAGKQLEEFYARAMSERVPMILDAENIETGHWLEVRIYPASIGGISVYFRDITDRKLAEQRLREAEELFRTLANSIPPMAWMTDHTGFTLWYNDRWYQYTGTTLDEARGWGWRAVLHPDFVDEVVDRMRYSFETGTPWEDTFPLRGKNGEYRWFLSRALPIRDEAGRIKRWFGTNTDITAHRDAELAIRDSRERLQAALEASGTGTFRWDIQTGTVTLDEELDRMFGLPSGQTIRTIDEFLWRVHPADRSAVTSTLEGCVRDGADFEMEFRVSRTEGPERWIYDRGRVFRDAEGHPAYVTGGCLDITARRRVEAVLRRSNDDLRQFAWAASHDLQEPLRTVTAYTQLLQRRYSERLDTTGLQFISFAVDAARRMETLLKGMRAYWQASADAEEPVVTLVDSRAALESALHNLAATIVETRAEITNGPLPVVMAQEVHVVQLFQNIIGNALKYRNPGLIPKIHIWADYQSGQWLISVRDNGIGISPPYFTQIFGIFKRLHTQKEYKGTGIGLAICQKVVESLGGRIWVESEGEGKGSTFRFTLPAASRRAPTLSELAEVAPSPATRPPSHQ